MYKTLIAAIVCLAIVGHSTQAVARSVSAPGSGQTLAQNIRYENQHRWGDLYVMLHPAHKRLVSEEAFRRCMEANRRDEVALVKVEKRVWATVVVPGTSTQTKALRITRRLRITSARGTSEASDRVNLFRIAGRWHWALDPEALSQCQAVVVTTPSTTQVQRIQSTTPASLQVPVVDAKGFTKIEIAGLVYFDYGVIVRNPSTAQAADSNLIITFFDATGNIVASSTGRVRYVPPGGRGADIGSVKPTGDPTRMEVQVSSTWTAPAPGSFQVESTTLSASPTGSVRVIGNVSSSFPTERQGVDLILIFFNASSEIVGGATRVIPFVPPGGSSPFDVSGSVSRAIVDHVEGFADD